jgi:hypothetical protein
MSPRNGCCTATLIPLRVPQSNQQLRENAPVRFLCSNLAVAVREPSWNQRGVCDRRATLANGMQFRRGNRRGNERGAAHREE